MKDNRTLLQKADMSLTDIATAGELLPIQAKKFFQIAIASAKLLEEIMTTTIGSKKQILPKIVFSGPILRPGVSGQALPEGDRSKPTTSKVEWDTKLFKAEVRLQDEVVEDNIERNTFTTTIRNMMATRIGLDVEHVCLNGDTGSADALLASLNGLRKQASTNVVNAGVTSLDKDVLIASIKAMPLEFRDKRNMAFFTSPDAVEDYHHTLTGRATILGDAALEKGITPYYSGIPVYITSTFPENLGGANNETEMLLMNPKNAQLAWWRTVKFELDRDVSAGEIIIVATMRFDIKFEHEPAVVKTDEITVA